MYNPNLINQKLVGNEYIGDCPFCGKENHFYFNRESGLFICHKCSESGNWFRFMKLVKKGNVEEEKTGRRKNVELVSIVLDDEVKQTKEDEIEPVELPEEFLPVTKTGTLKAYKYLTEKRKFTKQQIKKYNLMYAREGKFWNRVIIPIYMFGKLYGYFGRFIPIDRLNIKKKYLNGYGMDFSKMLWNYDNIDNSKPLVLVEGAFGGMRIGDNVVCTFGKKISKYQIELLKLKKVKVIILLYDADALSEINKFGGRLIEDFNVRIYPLKKGEDIDDFDNSDGMLYQKIFKFSKPYSFNEVVSSNLKI